MTARRTPWPGYWTIEQLVFPEEQRLVFRHLRGLTTGLWTEWRLTEVDGQVQVRAIHTWQSSWPIIGPLVAALICWLLIQPVTAETLAQIGQVVETGQATALRRLNEAYQ
jgi:hypothetical protein